MSLFKNLAILLNAYEKIDSELCHDWQLMPIVTPSHITKNISHVNFTSIAHVKSHEIRTRVNQSRESKKS